jgi:hypothetical protein
VEEVIVHGARGDVLRGLSRGEGKAEDGSTVVSMRIGCNDGKKRPRGQPKVNHSHTNKLTMIQKTYVAHNVRELLDDGNRIGKIAKESVRIVSAKENPRFPVAKGRAKVTDLDTECRRHIQEGHSVMKRGEALHADGPMAASDESARPTSRSITNGWLESRERVKLSPWNSSMTKLEKRRTR